MHTSTHAPHVQESDHEADLCRLYDKGLWQASADEASCVTVCCSCRSFSTGMLKLCGWHHLLRLLAWNSLELGALSAMYECRLGLLAFYRFPFAKTWRASLPGGLVAPLAVYYDTAEDEAIGGYANMGLACRPRPGADAIYEGRISNRPPEIALVLWLLFEHLPDTTC